VSGHPLGNNLPKSKSMSVSEKLQQSKTLPKDALRNLLALKGTLPNEALSPQSIIDGVSIFEAKITTKVDPRIKDSKNNSKLINEIVKPNDVMIGLRDDSVLGRPMYQQQRPGMRPRSLSFK